MSDTGTFHCSVIAPEKAVLECDARFVAFPAHDGEMGILQNRAPLLCRVGIGRLRVETPDEAHTFFVAGGFAQVVANKLTILTEQAARPEELDAGAAKQALVEARAMKIDDDESFDARQDAIKCAQVQLKLAK